MSILIIKCFPLIYYNIKNYIKNFEKHITPSKDIILIQVETEIPKSQ
jgi:hypothetical protein